MVVTWTTWNDTDSLVEFGTNPLKLKKTARGASKLFVDGGKEKRGQYIHRVTLEGLEANTTYCEAF